MLRAGVTIKTTETVWCLQAEGALMVKESAVLKSLDRSSDIQNQMPRIKDQHVSTNKGKRTVQA